MNGMGPLPRGMQSMNPMTPRPGKRPLVRSPQPHTTYKLAVPGRKLKQRGKAIIDTDPYRTSLKALQRGTNLPIQLVGGEVRGHGASSASRARQKQADQQEMINKALRNANKAPRQIRPAGVPDQEPLMNQAQVNNADLAQIEKLKEGFAGPVGNKGDMGPPGGGASSGSGSSGMTEEEEIARLIEQNRKSFQELQKKNKQKSADRTTPIKRKSASPRVYMPVLDYRRKRYPF